MRRSPVPRGFTLLEVILALALGSILLAAVWSSLELFWRYSDAGREESDQLQISRAVFQAIERDLRSTIPLPPAASSSTTGSSSTTSGNSTTGNSSATSSSGGTSGNTSGTTSSTGDTSSSSTTTSTAVSAVSPIHFVGDDAAFVCQSLLPQSLEQASLAASMQGAPAFRRDLQWVGWSASGKLPANTPTGSPVPPPPTLEEVDGRPQVVRWQMDVLGDQSNPNQQPESFPVPPEVIPELLRLRFRYFDGIEWLETWDSDLAGGLPYAVEIEIDVASTAEIEAVREARRQHRPRDAAFKTHKIVISLPMNSIVRQAGTTSS